jgi:hypothetical protein
VDAAADEDVLADDEVNVTMVEDRELCGGGAGSAHQPRGEGSAASGGGTGSEILLGRLGAQLRDEEVDEDGGEEEREVGEHSWVASTWSRSESEPGKKSASSSFSSRYSLRLLTSS